MKEYVKAVDNYFEEVDKRIDNTLTFIGIFSVLIASELLDIHFVSIVTLVMAFLCVRIGWDLINPNSREQKRYKQTLSIALAFISMAAAIWFVIRILLPYPFGMLY